MRTRAAQFTVALLAVLGIVPLRSPVAEPLRIYAAGSLSEAFTEIVAAFPAKSDVATPVFGPSGVLRERIEHGDHVDVFCIGRYGSAA